jgi:hypothetical protein
LLWKMQPRLHWGRSGPCMWLVYVVLSVELVWSCCPFPGAHFNN